MKTVSASRRALLGLAACAVAVLTLAGCASASPDAGGDDAANAGIEVAGVTIVKDDELAALVPEDIAERGTLTAIQFDNAAGSSFLDENDELAGWGPDLGRAVSEVLGLEFAPDVSGEFATFIPGIQNGRWDTYFASIIVTKERLDIVDIVAIHESVTGVITAEDAGLKIAKPEDLCGLRVGALAGSAFLIQMEDVAALCQEADKPVPTIDSFPQQGAATLAVTSDRIDAFMTAKSELGYLVSEGSIDGVEVQPLNYQPILEGIVVSPDSGLTEAITAAMNKLMEDGSYETILKSWGIDFGLLDEAVVNPEIAD